MQQDSHADKRTVRGYTRIVIRKSVTMCRYGNAYRRVLLPNPAVQKIPFIVFDSVSKPHGCASHMHRKPTAFLGGLYLLQSRESPQADFVKTNSYSSMLRDIILQRILVDLDRQ